MRKLRVALSLGFLEGDIQSQQFRHVLKQRGFQVTTNFMKSDIVVAHSAGCWLIPDNQAKLIIFIGLPLDQRRPWLTVWRSNLQDAKHLPIRQVLRILGASLYYGVTRPRRHITIMRRAGQAKPRTSATAHHIYIANQHDPWHRTPKLQHYLAEHAWTFISLPGSHDNLWQDPDYYTDIIKRYV